ncbi:hypothetical protein SLA2020_297880 [Shorea laevis]
MDRLSNAFAVLELDAEDENPRSASASTSASSNSGKSTSKINGSSDAVHAKHENKSQQSSMLPVKDYKLPLVWIDLEMTGLNVEVDRILEIACIITDGNLTKSVEGPDLVIHQSKECLDGMGEWCQNHHAPVVSGFKQMVVWHYLFFIIALAGTTTNNLRLTLGLTKKVLHSTITEREAEKQVIDFVKKHVGEHTPPLAGNSVYVDLIFLKKYMPNLASLFSHVLVDVSSVKALCTRWYPGDHKRAPVKKNKHRAMDDIRESIKELKNYKEKIFRAKK